MSDDKCPGTNNEGEPCGLNAGWGTDNDSGPCKFHGGAGGDVGDPGGAPEGNDNAARHEMYAERNAYYQRRSEREQELIDEIYADYVDEYKRRHGRDPLAGDDVKLFGIAVGLHKTEFRADDWPEERPQGLDSGHELVDRSEKRTAQGEPYYQYTPAAVLRGEKQVSQDVRMWLKDLDLFPGDDDDTTVNVNVHEELLDGLKAAHDNA